MNDRKLSNIYTRLGLSRNIKENCILYYILNNYLQILEPNYKKIGINGIQKIVHRLSIGGGQAPLGKKLGGPGPPGPPSSYGPEPAVQSH